MKELLGIGRPSESRIWSGDSSQGAVYTRKLRAEFCDTKDAENIIEI